MILFRSETPLIRGYVRKLFRADECEALARERVSARNKIGRTSSDRVGSMILFRSETPLIRGYVLRTSSDRVGSTFGRIIPRVLYHTNMSFRIGDQGCPLWVVVVVKLNKE
jgi:hypothetical protein